MKYILIGIILFLSGCDDSFSFSTEPAVECYNGVTYYSSSQRLAPAYNIEGDLLPCGFNLK